MLAQLTSKNKHKIMISDRKRQRGERLAERERERREKHREVEPVFDS